MAARIRVGIDVSPLGGAPTGIARYTYELLAALGGAASAEASTYDVTPVGHRHGLALPPSAAAVRGPRFPSRAAWTLGLVPLWASRVGLDLFHATSYYAPPLRGIPTAVTVHDLSVFAHPELHPRARVLRARSLLPRLVRAATVVIVPSAATAEEARRLLGLPVDRIHVVPEAPAAVFAERPEAADVAAALARHGLEPGYFLAVGTLEPRKNLPRIAEAAAVLRGAGDGDARLVVAGPPGWRFGADAERIRRIGGRHVRFVGHVPDAELTALMAGATALVYPSLCEGFGLPILEAMAAGLPVVTSNRGATAEVAGDAALLVDPLDGGALADAMARLRRDATLRRELAARGRERASEFSWERTARETLAVYDAALGRRRGARTQGARRQVAA